MQNKELKNTSLRECPFCGGENVGVFEHKYFYKSYLYTVNCFDCHFGLKLVETEEEAITAWNTRKPIDRIVEQLEAEKYRGMEGLEPIKVAFNFGINKALDIVKGVRID